MKNRFFLLLLLLCSFVTKAQTDSCGLRVSLLTCSPGQELYSTFGHTAIRVQDAAKGIDEVYNYGTFQFGPDFYYQFIKGRLDYFLSVETFTDFIYNYELEKRSVSQQVLRLTCAEKQRLYKALQVNATGSNKYYRYDFLYDNCTTRAKDIIANNTASPVLFQNILPKEIPSFRDQLHVYLDNGKQYWSKFGIDILLASPVDKKVSNEQSMFLPDYLFKGFDEALLHQEKLVENSQLVLQVPSVEKESSFLTPQVVFYALLVLIMVLSFVRSKSIQHLVSVFDFLFFLALGLTGCFILFMWFGTEHTVCRYNYNLLWAVPTHVLAAFFLQKNKQWLHYYLLATIALQAFLLVGWIFLPQEFNLAFLPIILLILLRSWLIILKPHAYATEKHSD